MNKILIENTIKDNKLNKQEIKLFKGMLDTAKLCNIEDENKAIQYALYYTKNSVKVITKQTFEFFNTPLEYWEV